MKFGKFEIDWFAILMVCIILLWILLGKFERDIEIERLKTEQLKTQLQIQQINIEEEN